MQAATLPATLPSHARNTRNPTLSYENSALYSTEGTLNPNAQHVIHMTVYIFHPPIFISNNYMQIRHWIHFDQPNLLPQQIEI
jgi:hypothetical protein